MCMNTQINITVSAGRVHILVNTIRLLVGFDISVIMWAFLVICYAIGSGSKAENRRLWKERLCKEEGFKTRVKNTRKMSTTESGSEPDDGEELGDDDAPDW